GRSASVPRGQRSPAAAGPSALLITRRGVSVKPRRAYRARAFSFSERTIKSSARASWSRRPSSTASSRSAPTPRPRQRAAHGLGSPGDALELVQGPHQGQHLLRVLGSGEHHVHPRLVHGATHPTTVPGCVIAGVAPQWRRRLTDRTDRPSSGPTGAARTPHRTRRTSPGAWPAAARGNP